jgi:hypothetical protein
VLKIYADRRFVTPGGRHVVLLYPFWGPPPDDSPRWFASRFDRYMELGPTLFELSDIQTADLAVLPMPWEDVRRDPEARRLADSFVAHARAHGKQAALFFLDDSSEPVPYDDVLVFRTSLFASQRTPLEFAQPSWTEDFLQTYLETRLPIREKGEKPVVGFCGHAGPLAPPVLTRPIGRPMKTRLKRLLTDTADKLGFRKRLAPRARALRVLWDSPLIDANFVMRDQFMGPLAIQRKAKDPIIVDQVRRDFVENMIQSDYVLCARGNGNYSRRFYEALSCGRIPIFLNTDCVLPYEDVIDWRKYVVWVEESDISRIDRIVSTFHASISNDEFMALQRECRRLWVDYASPQGYLGNIDLHLGSGGSAQQRAYSEILEG